MKHVTSQGGGPPVITGGTASLPHPNDLRATCASGSIALAINEETRARGQRIVEVLRKAVRACSRYGSNPSVKSVRELGRLVDLYPMIAHRLPEFIDYLRWLEEHGRDCIVKRIVAGVVCGRPREGYFYLVLLLDLIAEREGSIARAASIAESRFGSDFGMSAATMRNAHSKYKDLYRLAEGCRYVDGAELIP